VTWASGSYSSVAFPPLLCFLTFAPRRQRRPACPRPPLSSASSPCAGGREHQGPKGYPSRHPAGRHRRAATARAAMARQFTRHRWCRRCLISGVASSARSRSCSLQVTEFCSPSSGTGLPHRRRVREGDEAATYEQDIGCVQEG
jgi:hypothetical protein